MERKIGEIFEFGGEWYQCVVAIDGCRECSFRAQDYCTRHSECFSDVRSDGISVIFKKLEKVGEPYRRWLSPFNNIMVQRYRLYGRNVIMPDEPIMLLEPNYKNSVEIEIKQIKEDMEENKLNLKPFDIQKAREGKPVSTRDGHKARIICFDYNGETGDYPIVALVHYNKGNKCYERVLKYTSDGMFNKYGDCQHDDDLMMLPEKKEGWINLYKWSTPIYKSEEEAKACVGSEKMNEYIASVKVQWEE